MRLPLRGLVVLVVAAVLLAPAPALACPVCFGNADGPVAQGMNLAILALLGITGVMLGSFAAFFIYLARRAKLAQDSAQDSAEGMHPQIAQVTQS